LPGVYGRAFGHRRADLFGRLLGTMCARLSWGSAVMAICCHGDLRALLRDPHRRDQHDV